MARFGLLLAPLVAALVLVDPFQEGAGGGGDPGPSVETTTQRPSGTLVFLSGRNRLVSIDVSSGRRTVRRVRSLAACGPELHVTDGHLIFAGVRRRWTVVYSVPVSLDRPPKRLGRAHAFVPSATEGRVWLAGVDCDLKTMAGVKEVTVDGQVTAASRRRVPNGWLAGAVGDGLVLHRGRSPEVWDPATGRSRRLPLETVLEAEGALIVGCERSRCRRAVMLDAETARTVVVRPRRGYQLDYMTALSPDDSLMAAPAVAGGRWAGGPWSVALVNTGDGTSSIVPGSDTVAGYPQLSWSAASGWLFIRARDRVMAYRPGAERAITLPFKLPRRAVSFVAG